MKKLRFLLFLGCVGLPGLTSKVVVPAKKVEVVVTKRKMALINLNLAMKRSKNFLKASSLLDEVEKKQQDIMYRFQSIYQDKSLSDEQKRNKLEAIRKEAEALAEKDRNIKEKLYSHVERFKEKFTGDLINKEKYDVVMFYPNAYACVVYSPKYIEENCDDWTASYTEGLEKAFRGFTID